MANSSFNSNNLMANKYSYRTSFTNSDLVAGVLTVTHNLGYQYCQVMISNNSDKEVLPDFVTFTNSNSLSVDLSSFGSISGAWNILVIYIGAQISVVPNAIQDNDADTKIQVEESSDEDKIRFDVGGSEVGVWDSDANGGLETTYGFFHDRGDPSSDDYTVGDFTTDETWNDLDLSGIVPEGTKAVLLRVLVKDGLTDQSMQFRKNGNSDKYAASGVYTQAVDVSNLGTCICACDANRVIEYKGSNTTFTVINVTVLGWWK